MTLFREAKQASLLEKEIPFSSGKLLCLLALIPSFEQGRILALGDFRFLSSVTDLLHVGELAL